MCGTIRREGANAYIYAKAGSAACTAYFCYKLCTAITDGSDDNLAAPLRLTTVAIANLTVPLNVFAMCIANVATGAYGWFLREGIATLYMMTDGAAAVGGYLKPSTSTLGMWETAATSCGFAFALVGKTTAEASAGGTGVLSYINFASPRQA